MAASWLCDPRRVQFIFGDAELDLTGYELRRSGVVVPLEPQAFDVLSYLVRHRERVVAKEELMDEIWGGRFVSETAVTSRIKQVRRAVGDDGQAQHVIRTVHGRGYRFVADVAERAGPPNSTTRQSLRRRCQTKRLSSRCRCSTSWPTGSTLRIR